MDFFRTIQWHLASYVGLFLLVLWIAFLVRKHAGLSDDENKTVSTVRNVILILVLVGGGWHIVSTAALNETPRSTIDRSIANDRGNILDRQSEEKTKGDRK